jgi:hypothetical protein
VAVANFNLDATMLEWLHRQSEIEQRAMSRIVNRALVAEHDRLAEQEDTT